jgi:hypothetical protein
LKEIADDISKCNEIEKYSSERAENLVGKGKLLVTSNLSFAHNVF